MKKLDDWKRQALQEIWRAQPIFALQVLPALKSKAGRTLGPPRDGDNALLQVAATAQANSTVDFLGSKPISAQRWTHSLIVVRLGAGARQLPAAADRRLKADVHGAHI